MRISDWSSDVCSSDLPSVASVAPFGRILAVYTPDPVAVGIPTSGDPILVDLSASITTNRLTGRLHGEGRRLDHAWVIAADRNPSTDPAVLFTDPPCPILPPRRPQHRAPRDLQDLTPARRNP